MSRVYYLPVSVMFVYFRRDHHHGPAGPRAEVRIHPDSQSCGWRSGPTAENWHRHGNNFVAILSMIVPAVYKLY